MIDLLDLYPAQARLISLALIHLVHALEALGPEAEAVVVADLEVMMIPRKDGEPTEVDAPAIAAALVRRLVAAGMRSIARRCRPRSTRRFSRDNEPPTDVLDTSASAGRRCRCIFRDRSRTILPPEGAGLIRRLSQGPPARGRSSDVSPMRRAPRAYRPRPEHLARSIRPPTPSPRGQSRSGTLTPGASPGYESRPPPLPTSIPRPSQAPALQSDEAGPTRAA
jgi:hypothetical protein